MSIRTRKNLLHWLRKAYSQACRCQAIAAAAGLYVKAQSWNDIQETLEREINELEEGW